MRWLTVVVVVVGVVPVMAAPIPAERLEAERIVGTWKMTRGAHGETDVHLELDLYQSGRMVIRQRMPDGRLSIYQGSYRVIGDQMPYDVQQGMNRKAETLTITKLTDTELIVVDPDGLKEEFVRIKKDPRHK
ncbi:MAG: TIGR03066 family protein [Gemmataceae bacterium]|nr:TIGR03066 family protein [Gemmata sp.]MDW8197075.1 TIGR03066 family protein [Gemmataceae bacterium]